MRLYGLLRRKKLLAIMSYSCNVLLSSCVSDFVFVVHNIFMYVFSVEKLETNKLFMLLYAYMKVCDHMLLELVRVQLGFCGKFSSKFG